MQAMGTWNRMRQPLPMDSTEFVPPAPGVATPLEGSTPRPSYAGNERYGSSSSFSWGLASIPGLGNATPSAELPPPTAAPVPTAGGSRGSIRPHELPPSSNYPATRPGLGKFAAAPDEYSPGKGEAADILHVWSRFPQLFTGFLLALYAIPITICLYLAFDHVARFWCGAWLLLVLILPIMFLFTHALHSFMGMPSKLAVILCLVGSAALLITLTDVVMLKARHISSGLYNDECGSPARKHDIELQYQQALGFYNNCTQSRAQAEGTTVEQQVSTVVIQDCWGYDIQEQANNAWDHLRKLEVEEGCAGWCTRDQPLWTFNDAKDSCSTAAGAHLQFKVQNLLFKALVFSIAAFGFAAVSLVTVAPHLHKVMMGQ